jgi:3-oxoacyl-[acyl-carrier protein] reductase
MGKSETVIITGASRGIGKATAELFAASGYNVVINYHQSQQAAADLLGELQCKGYSAALYQADVTNKADVDAMMDECINRFGRIDLLVNNAGISKSALFIDISEAEWETMLAVNLKGVFYCSQSVLRYILPQKRGKIINIASIWGMVGAACEVHYSAAKAGVIGLTKALAKELGPSNIQVNCIAPGIIQTDMLALYNQSEIDALIHQTPINRLGTPLDIAHAALFLASPAGDFITGQVISPNGGFVI